MLEVELIMERKSQYMLLHKLNLLDGKIIDADDCDNPEPTNTQHYLSLFGLDKSVMAELTS
jgi:hypothetical protein